MTSSRALVCPWAVTEPSKDHKDCGTVPLPTLVTLPSDTAFIPLSIHACHHGWTVAAWAKP